MDPLEGHVGLGCVKVVDSRLAAGRGEQFTNAYLNKQAWDDREDADVEADDLATSACAASAELAIPMDNLGYKMLQKMGWKGQGLGRDEQVRERYEDRSQTLTCMHTHRA
jgi:hypothetical protein